LTGGHRRPGSGGVQQRLSAGADEARPQRQALSVPVGGTPGAGDAGGRGLAWIRAIPRVNSSHRRRGADRCNAGSGPGRSPHTKSFGATQEITMTVALILLPVLSLIVADWTLSLIRAK
jgi:hypothetical protein